MKNRRILPLLGLTLAMLSAVVVAHIVPVIRGVHFKNELIDFGQPPARYDVDFDVVGNGLYRPGTDYLEHRGIDYEDWELHKRQVANRKRRAEQHKREVLAKARTLEKAGRFKQVKAVYEAIRREDLADRNWTQVRLEIQPLAAREPKARGLSQFLTYLEHNAMMGAESEYADWLKPFVAYQACVTASDYERFAKRFPNHVRTQAALIMVPRLLLAEALNLRGQGYPSESLQRSKLALEALLKRFPNTRFKDNAYGWQGRIAFLKGRYEEAIALYDRQFRSASYKVRLSATVSIAECADRLNQPERTSMALARGFGTTTAYWRPVMASQFRWSLAHVDGEHTRRFVSLLLNDPETFPSYLDLRTDLTNATPAQRRNTARLAEAWATKHPKNSKTAHVLARAAEIWYSQNHYLRAATMAQRALSVGKDKQAVALALYIQGSCARRKGDLSAAQQAYERIISEFPQTYVAEGAREPLALIYEKQGRNELALEQYVHLKYDKDVAFLVDIKMSPESILKAASRPNLKSKRELLRFSAALRWVRTGDYAKAGAILTTIPRSKREEFAKIRGRQEYEPYYDNGDSLQDPLVTAHRLAHFDRLFEKAKGSSAKAEALYLKAAYFYRKRNLMLYNASLWEWDRAYAFSFSWNHAVATKDDVAAVKKHHYEHECMAQALAICDRIVAKYPKANIAPEAAMLGVKCSMRLASLNAWWRSEEESADHYGHVIELCRFITKRAPGTKLAAKAKLKIPEYKRARTESAAFRLEYPKEPSKYPGFGW